MARFGVKEVADVTFFDLANSSKPSMFLDSLKLSNLENDAESSYVTGGRGNPRLMSFDYNRTATFAVQDALMNPKALAMQAGAEVKKGITQVHKREVLEAVAGATAGTTEVTLASAPVSGSSTTFKTTDGYDHEVEVTPSTEAQTMVYSDVDVPVGQKVIVYYQYETTSDAEQVIIASDKYSGFYKVVGQTVIRNSFTNVDELFEIELPKAKIMSNFSINLSAEGEPAVFDMNLDVFKPDGVTDMVKLTRIG